MSRFPQALRAIVFVVIAVSAAVALALDDRANSVRSLVIELAGASFSESRPGPALTAQMPELLWPPQGQTAPRSVLGPSTLIDPTGDGGFESGLGTWTAVNGTSSNRWFIGTAAGASSGGSAAFIGSSASTYTDGVAQAGSSAVFLYKDITFPAGETLITLTYDYKQPTLDGTFDLTRVFLVPTTTTLTPGSQLSSGQISLDSQGQGGQASFGSRTVTIPPSAAGTTQRLVFQWKNDATSPYGSAAIDSVSLVSNVPTVYTWNGSTSTSFSTAANWTPARTAIASTDILQFNSGGSRTVTGIPTQTIGQLLITNSTTVSLQSSSTATLTISGGTGPDLDVAGNSSLQLNSPSGVLTLAFSGSQTANIAGTLSLSGAANVYNAANSDTTVVGTVNNSSGVITGSSSTLSFASGSIYNHLFTTSSGTIPSASWSPTSTVNVTGYTTNATATGGTGQVFGNFTWNCPGQSSSVNLSGAVPGVAGTFSVVSTGGGTSELRLSGSTSYTANWNNFAQTGGTLDLANGSSASAAVNVSGSFSQSGGVLKSAATATSTVTLNFSGSAGAQNVNFHNASPTGPITYRISNPAGINLTGTGTLTSTFAIPSTGGVRISSNASTPINTGLALSYGTGAVLTYDSASGPQIATAKEFPAANGPRNLTVNNSSTAPNNLVTIPFSRNIASTLTMAAGNLALGSNTIELGTSASASGILTYTAGSVVSGSMKRWFPASSLTLGSDAGRFPFGKATSGAPDDRTLWVGFGGVLTSGGSVTITANSVTGTTDLTPFVDGGVTVDRRTNTNWAITQSGIAGGNASLRLTAGNIGSVSDPGSLRLIRATDAVGTFAASSGSNSLPVVNRTNLGQADLNNTFHIGSSSATNSLAATVTAIASGNWGDPLIWDGGVVPSATNLVVIPSPFTVNLAGGSAPYFCNGLNIAAGGGLNSAAANTLNIGPAGGSNRLLSVSGALSIGSGAINLNGSAAFTASSAFIMTGGAFNIDGNDGTAGGSVAANTNLLQFTNGSSGTNISATGGIITIVDPPSSGAGAALSISKPSSSTAVTAFQGSTLQFGDGTSTTAGAATGFIVDTYVGFTKVPLGNVIVNGGSGATRFVKTSSSSLNSMDVNGDLTVNSGSELRALTSHGPLTLNGNLINNGIVTTAGSLAMSVTNGLLATPSTISGPGTFRDSVSSPTASFANLTISNPAGVTLASNASISGSLVLTSGRLQTGTSTLSLLTTATVSRTSGYVDGNFSKVFTSAGTKSFEVGTDNGYSPATVAATTGTFPSAFTVRAVQGAMPGISGVNKLGRYWSLAGGTVTGANLTFTYLSSDIVGTASSYKFVRSGSGVLATFAPTGTPSTASASINGVTSFSDWTLAEPNAIQYGTIGFAAPNIDDPETDSASHLVTVPVSRTGGSDSSVTVNYTISDGTAKVADGDYSVDVPSGTLTWSPGDAAIKNLTIAVNGDSLYEANESIILTLSGPGGGSVLGTSVGTVTITNDDTPPEVSVNNVEFQTNSAAANGFTISQNAASGKDTLVPYSTVSGSATGSSTCSPGVDFILQSATATIPAGSMSVELPPTQICADNVQEPSETFTISLGTPSNATVAENGGTGLGTIASEDLATASIGTPAAVLEGNSGNSLLVFPVTLDNPNSVTTTVSYSFGSAADTAALEVDYNDAGSGSITIPAGSQSGSVTVSVSGDTAYEADESFTVTIDSEDVTVSTNSSVGTIVNDDAPPATLTVNSSLDTDDGACLSREFGNGCTLREAIIAANANDDLSTIEFAVPGAGVHTISPAGFGLPEVSAPISIRGLSQPGALPNTLSDASNAVLLIEIDGGTIAGGSPALKLGVGSDGSTVEGLIVNNAGPNTFIGNGLVVASNNNVVKGCWIGLDAYGVTDLGNASAGVEISGSGNLIGGVSPADRNVISGNNAQNVKITGVNAYSNRVFGNLIGTTKAGDAAPSSTEPGGASPGSGIHISDGAHENQVGSGDALGRNVISGNGNGVVITGSGSTENVVLGNYIGPDVTGLSSVGNLQAGVDISDAAESNTIGGANSGDRNLISGNLGSFAYPAGISIRDAGTDNNQVLNNGIGIGATGAPLGNGGGNPAGVPGVLIFNGASNNFIGGSSETDGNVIANNSGDGIRIFDGSAPIGVTSGNQFFRNSIYANGKLGINLVAQGEAPNEVTPNDAGDADGGANGLQNFPVISEAEITGSTTHVRGGFNSEPGKTYSIDFYLNDTCGLTGFGEGRIWVGSLDSVTTDASGSATFDLTGAPLTPLKTVTAIAIDPNGNTSEFSACATVQQGAPGTIVFSDANYNVNESDGTASVTVQRWGNGSDGAVRSTLTVSNGSATAPGDYAPIESYDIVFGDGETADKTVNVSINDDLIYEWNETILLSLSNTTTDLGAAPPQNSVVTILNNDVAPTISVVDLSQLEGTAMSTAFSVTLSKSGSTEVPAVVVVTTQDGTAGAPSDYTSFTDNIVFEPTETTKTVNVTINSDSLYELDETFGVNLSNPHDATIGTNGTVIIQNDDALPTVTVNDKTFESASVAADSFTVTLSEPAGVDVTVPYATSGVTATEGASCSAGADYVAQSGSLVFTAGQSGGKTVHVDICDDNIREPDETFTLNLGALTNAQYGDNQGVGTISSDDSTAASITEAALTEGDGGSANMAFTVTLEAESSTATTINYTTTAVTATEGVDYNGPGNSIVIPAGSLTGTITVPITGDAIYESAETFTVTITSPDVAVSQSTATGTITNNDAPPVINATSVNQIEGTGPPTSFQFTLNKVGLTELTAGVNYSTVTDSAISPSDYTAIPLTSITFLPNEVSKTVTVTVTADSSYENDESFTLDISGGTDASAGTDGIGLIANDDAKPVVTIDDATFTGNSAANVLSFTVTASGATEVYPITVDYSTADGSATQPGDYTTTTGTLTFTSTGTQNILVPIVGDTTQEPIENFFVNIAASANVTVLDSQAVGTISNDDSSSISISGASGSEGDSGITNMSFTVQLSSPRSSPTVVNYVTGDVTATAGADYVATGTGSISIPANATTGTISIPINGDQNYEADETFTVTISAPGPNPGVLTAIGTITNDDPRPTLSFSSSTFSGTEGSQANVIVLRSGAAGDSVSVNYVTNNGTATAGTCGSGGDYEAASGTLNFAPNELSKTFTVSICSDLVVENAETVELLLTSPTGGAATGLASATLTIANAGSGNSSIAGRVVRLSGAGVPDVTVTLSNGSSDIAATTDATGAYNFVNLADGVTYTVTPTCPPSGSCSSYVFDPSFRQYPNLAGTITNADFVAYAGDNPRNLRLPTVRQPTIESDVVVPVLLDSRGNEHALSFALAYDSNYLTFAAATCGQAAPSGCTVIATPAAGGTRFDVTLGSGVTFSAGERVVLEVTFSPSVGPSALNTPIAFAPTPRRVENLGSIGVPTDYENGSIIFAQGLEGDVAGGTPPNSGAPGGPPIDSGDIVRIRRLATGLSIPNATNNEFQRADVAPYVPKGDGKINAGDVTVARRYAGGTLLGVLEPAAGPTAAVTASPIAEIKTYETPISEAASAPGAIRIGSARAPRGARVSVPVEVNARASENALSFTVHYDPDRLSNPTILLGRDLVAATLTAGSFADTGDLSVLIDLPPGRTIEAGDLKQIAVLNFDVRPDAPIGSSGLTFSSDRASQNVSSVDGDALDSVFFGGTLEITAAPTAASASLSGRVVTADGFGIPNIVVTLVNDRSEMRRVVSGPFGYYSFETLEAGSTYIVSVASKRFSFGSPTRVVTLNDSASGVDFTAERRE